MGINKILYFLDFPNTFGGAANTLLRQAVVMKRYISDILITIPLDDTGSAMGEFARRCEQYDLPYSFQKFSVSISAETVDVVGIKEDFDNIERYIKNYDPDIVHSTQINVCVEMVCRKLKIAHIMNIYPCAEYIFRLNYPNIFPHYHICDSEYYQKRWMERLQLDSVCIRNMCEITKIEKYHLSAPVLICVGSLCEWKNQLEIIKAVHRLILEDMKIHMVFVGTSESVYGQKCFDYIERNHINRWIEMKGFIPSAEIEIAKSDALICGSTVESFPNVIGEAMAGKTVVISTPVAGIPEILKDDINAYICDGYKADNLYLAIKKFLVERGTKKQKELLRRAFHTYLTEFSPEAVGNNLYSFYEHVYSDRKTRKTIEIQRENILEPYLPLIEMFEAHKNLFQKCLQIRSIIWLIPYIKDSIRIKSFKKLVVWGAGVYGAEAVTFAKLYFPELEIDCFVDREKKGEYLGYPVRRIEEIDREGKIIWIAFLHGQMEASRILMDMGLEYHKDFFFLAPMNL